MSRECGTHELAKVYASGVDATEDPHCLHIGGSPLCSCDTMPAYMYRPVSLNQDVDLR